MVQILFCPTEKEAWAYDHSSDDEVVQQYCQGCESKCEGCEKSQWHLWVKEHSDDYRNKLLENVKPNNDLTISWTDQAEWYIVCSGCKEQSRIDGAEWSGSTRVSNWQEWKSNVYKRLEQAKKMGYQCEFARHHGVSV